MTTRRQRARQRLLRALGDSSGVQGEFTLTVHGPDGRIQDRRQQKNLMCSAGLAVLTSAVNWSGVVDQNLPAGLGLPEATAVGGIPTGGIYLFPLYGAVGSSSTPATAGDTQLGAELGRETIANSFAASNQIVWTCFLPTTPVDWLISEAGMFANSSATADSGALLDRTVFGSSITKPASSTGTLQISFSF